MHTCIVASPSTSGSLHLISATANSNFFFFRNRAGYQNGDHVVIEYDVGRTGGNSVTLASPSVLWLRNGIPVSDSLTNTPRMNGGLNTVLSFTFAESDAGVYQCVFTDIARSEVFVTDPIRLDTGEGIPNTHYVYIVAKTSQP